MSKRISFTLVVSDDTFRDIETTYRYRNLRNRNSWNISMVTRMVSRIFDLDNDNTDVLVGTHRLQLAQFEDIIRRNASAAVQATPVTTSTDAASIQRIVDLAIRAEVARMNGRIDELQQAVGRNEGRTVRNVRNITRLEVGVSNPEMLNLPSADEMLEVLALDNTDEI